MGSAAAEDFPLSAEGRWTETARCLFEGDTAKKVSGDLADTVQDTVGSVESEGSDKPTNA